MNPLPLQPRNRVHLNALVVGIWKGKRGKATMAQKLLRFIMARACVLAKEAREGL